MIQSDVANAKAFQYSLNILKHTNCFLYSVTQESSLKFVTSFVIPAQNFSPNSNRWLVTLYPEVCKDCPTVAFDQLLS